MDIEQEIKDHQSFWTVMYGLEKWNEISSECKTKNPTKMLDFLNEKLFEYEQKEFTPISVFVNVEDTKPKDFYLEKWLFHTLNPESEVEEDVELYRSTFDKKIKSKLLCCTISATFKDVRNLENIKQKNRLICIDVDRHTKSKKKKSNPCIDMQLAKEILMQHPSTFYVGFSCSGDGLYAILRIYDSDRLDEYFAFFEERFSNIGINIDSSCKDYTRLRFISIDKEAYFNPNAKYYKLPEKKEYEVKQSNNRNQNIDNVDKVEKLCDEIDRRSIDITSSYEDWMKIGAALFNEFGDMGGSYFHRISKHHPEYSIKSCEKKFNQCRKVSNVKLNTLFYIASGYGVRY